MNYLQITPCDMTNGKDFGVCLWVAGCDKHCPGCHNPESWDPDAGKVFDAEAKSILFEALNKSWVKRFTLTGGDPLSCYNIKESMKLLREIKLKFPHIEIWVYTGYEIQGIPLKFLKNIDVLVDGPYIEKYRDITLAFRGSTNQRIIYMSKYHREEVEDNGK